MSRTFFCWCAVVLAASSICNRAAAVPVSFEATDNATVRPAGPRAGSSGKAFFNIAGSSNAANASFGVIDYNFSMLAPPLAGTVTAVSNVTLKLTQNNAAFSFTGPISFYLSDQPGVDISPTNTNLMFVAGMDGAASVDADLGTLTPLGSGTYTSAGVGMNPIDSFSLNFTGAALTSLLSAINNDTTLRLVVTPDAATTDATYTGFSFVPSPPTNPALAGPTLEFDATVSGGFAAADFNEDTFVNGADMNTNWRTGFPKASGAVHGDGDADGDFDVDGNDYLIWQQQLAVPLIVGAPVPEPAAAALLAAALGGTCLSGRRLRRTLHHC